MLPGRAGSLLVLAVGSVAGLVLYVAVERLIRSPELAWWAAGLRRGPAQVDPVGEAEA